MQIVCCIGCVVYFIIAILVNRKAYGSMVIFFGLWVVILWLDLFNRYGNRVASESIYFIIFIGLTAFLIGSLMVSYVYRNRVYKGYIMRQSAFENVINYRII